VLYITPDFDLGTFGQQAVASLLLGAVVGALIAGQITDGIGRHRTLLTTAVIFAFGAVASALSPNEALLITSRFLIGLGLGASSMVVPLYLAEMAPKQSRGRLVSLNQFLIVVGILIAYGVGYAFASSGAWRWMLGLAAIPAVLMFIGLLTLPESPRWLLSKGREDEALAVLRPPPGRPGGRRGRRDPGDDQGGVDQQLPRPPLSATAPRPKGLTAN